MKSHCNPLTDLVKTPITHDEAPEPKTTQEPPVLREKKTVHICFPQIVVGTKLIEVTQEQYEDLIEHHKDRAEFIWKNLNEQERAMTPGRKWIEDGFDIGLSAINPTFSFSHTFKLSDLKS